MDENKLAGFVLLDHSKAFDKYPYNWFLENVIIFLESYLDDCYQAVPLKNNISEFN